MTIRLVHGLDCGAAAMVAAVAESSASMSSFLFKSQISVGSLSAAEATNLDIKKQPFVFQARLSQVREQVGEARHRLPRLAHRPHRSKVVPVAVADLGVLAEAALQRPVLHAISTRT